MNSISVVREFCSWTHYLRQLGLHYNVYNTIWDRFDRLHKENILHTFDSRLADGQLRSHQRWAASPRARGKRIRSPPPPTSFPTTCFSTRPILSCSYTSWQATAKVLWLTTVQRGLFLTVNILFSVHSLIGWTPTLTSTAQPWIFSTPWTWQDQRKPLLRRSWCIMPWTTLSR